MQHTTSRRLNNILAICSLLGLLLFLSPTSFGVPASPGGNAKNAGEALDVLSFGDSTSESRHRFAPETSRVHEDENGEIARRLLPAEQPENAEERLGSMSFTMKCDPSKRTYLTVKFAAPDSWKSEHTGETLMLFDGDKMIGYLRGRGSWPPLDFGLTRGRERSVRATHSDYWYAMHRVPKYMTDGKNRVDLRVVSWNAQGPSQRVYRAYTHTKPLFELPSDDRDHNLDIGTPAGPEEDPMAPVIKTINNRVRDGQNSDTVEPTRAFGLAVAHSRKDKIDAVDQDAIVETVKSTIDQFALKQAKSSPPKVFNRGWAPHGELARAYTLLHEAFQRNGLLTEPIQNHPNGKVSRGKAYTQFFKRALEWRSRDRRPIYNQTIIVTVGLVRMSQALRKLNPQQAPDRSMVNRWIDEAIGRTGMTHRDGEKRRPVYLSGSLHMASEAGMPKEFGFVMDYGGVGMRETAYLAMETGRDRVMNTFRDMVRARSHFKWFVRQMETGRRWSAIDGVLSRRHLDHPGRIDGLKGYGMTPFVYVKVSGDEVSKRWAELATEHGVLEHRWGRLGLYGLIYHLEGYRKLQNMKPSEYVLPMNRKKSVWADPDMGLISITDGKARLMINLNHSAGALGDDWGVNRVARVHYHGPRGDRVMMVDMRRVEFPFEGSTWKRPDHLERPSTFLGSNAERNRYLPWKGKEGRVKQAMAGRELPQASRPNGEPWPSAERDELDMRMPDPRVGMGVHYRELRIGPYLIAMNSTGAPERGFGPGTNYELQLPDGVQTARDTSTGKKVTGNAVTVPPRTTRILKLKQQ